MVNCTEETGGVPTPQNKQQLQSRFHQYTADQVEVSLDIEDFFALVYQNRDLSFDTVELVNDATGEVLAHKVPTETVALAPYERPGAPVTRRMMNKVAKGNEAWYAVASTIQPLEKQENREAEGKPQKYRTRKIDTVRMMVVMFDDIGTRVSAADFAKHSNNLVPSIITETSPGNFQYLYILSVPLATTAQMVDRFHAQQRAMLEKAGTDAGAVGITRKFKVPGSKHATKDFRASSVAINSNPATYTLMELVQAFEITAPDIERHTKGATKPAATGVAGSDDAPVRSQQSRAPGEGTYNGRRGIQGAGMDADRMWQHLLRTGLVRTPVNGDGWAGVACPFTGQGPSLHEPGSITSTVYSPWACGKSPLNQQSRRFHCSHETCKARRQQEYYDAIDALAEAANLDAPRIQEYDHTEYLLSRFAYMESGKYAVDMWITVSPRSFARIGDWKDSWAHMLVDNGKDDGGMVEATARWRRSPYKRIITAREFNPLEAEGLFHDGDINLVNTYHRPWFEPTAQVPQHFLNHLEFLLPDEKEREYFLDWLACMIQNPGRRMPMVLLATDEAYGVGRSLLNDSLESVFKYVKTVPWETFSGENKNRATYDDWKADVLLVVIEEIKTPKALRTAVYEVIKEQVDTKVKTATLNIKGREQVVAKMFFNTLGYTNHLDALLLPKGDRRVSILECANTPRPQSYYDVLCKALPGEAGAIYHWLHRRDLAAFDSTTPIDTRLKHVAIECAQPPEEQALIHIRDHWPALMIREDWELACRTACEVLGLDSFEVLPLLVGKYKTMPPLALDKNMAPAKSRYSIGEDNARRLCAVRCIGDQATKDQWRAAGICQESREEVERVIECRAQAQRARGNRPQAQMNLVKW